jgi:hypothetical protein
VRHGTCHGYQAVDRRIRPSSDGTLASGPLNAARHAADGSVILALCGSANGSRLQSHAAMRA